VKNHSDIVIIGGGINGTAIAAEAANRGLRATLVEKNDLASGTSSASSKLIHGGLRYLETYEFHLVREALAEQTILLNRAPHLVSPLEFVLPYEPHMRPAWLIRLGLFFYDHLAQRKQLPHSKLIHFKKNIRGLGLLSHLEKGFSYFDCFTNDARLVITNALSAKKQGANILTYTEFLSATRENNEWKIKLQNKHNNEINIIYASFLINVAGPWVKAVQSNIQSAQPIEIEWVQGSHIIVPKLYEGNFAYILQNEDQRIVFAIPFQDQFTLIGTTDIIFKNDLNHIVPSSDEILYLCDLINHYFKKKITPSDVVWHYSGVRCLQASTNVNPAKITRDYKLIVDNAALTVIGGKLTTHRMLAEKAIDLLRPFFKKIKNSTTAHIPLPGGDIRNFNLFKQDLKKQFSELPTPMIERYIHAYGTRAYLILNNVNRLSDLGKHWGHGLFQKEIDYLINEEWATTVDDILWRRSHLGLFFSSEEADALSSCF